MSGDHVGDGLECLGVAIAARLGFGGVHQAVDALDASVGDAAIEPRENTVPVFVHGACDSLRGFEPRALGPANPLVKEQCAPVARRLRVDIQECQPHAPGARRLEVGRRGCVEHCALVGRQVRRILGLDGGRAQVAEGVCRA